MKCGLVRGLRVIISEIEFWPEVVSGGWCSAVRYLGFLCILGVFFYKIFIFLLNTMLDWMLLVSPLCLRRCDRLCSGVVMEWFEKALYTTSHVNA